MKLDFSGLESSAPLYGESNGFLFDGLSAAPSFDVPVTSDVSFSHLNLVYGKWFHPTGNQVNAATYLIPSPIVSVWFSEVCPNGQASKGNDDFGFYF